MENMENNSENMGRPTPPIPAPDKLMASDKKYCHHLPWRHCCGHCQGNGHRALRVLLILLVVIIIFAIGASFGAHGHRGREYRDYGSRYNQRQGMMGQVFNRRTMNQSYNFQGKVQVNPTGNVSPLMGWAYSQTNGQATVNLAQLVGAITKIEGNKITIGNNNQPITFNVASSTVITNAAGPLSISNLKVGQNIIVIGSSDANQQFNAQTINIQ